MRNNNQYIRLAELFRYPETDANEKVKQCQNMLGAFYPEAAALLKNFSDYFLSIDQDKKEELFTKTFDVQPICYLDLGYVIFGEDYKRGSFLLHMKEEQQYIGRDCSPELPDHLYHVLYLITLHPDTAFVNELVAKVLVPAIKKMIKEFDSARVELKVKVLKKLHNAVIQEELNQGNVYQYAFKALLYVLETDFAEALTLHKHQEEDAQKDAFFTKRNTVPELVNHLKNDEL